ncbi:MAG: four helix bundle protein [Acidobacteriia bacterium]|nr:four helix bundle protein [Terriglobia bacterium]
MSHSYKDLIVWQRARALASAIYQITESFPRSEVYGLTSQLRRAAVSVVSNIAEGQGRLTKGEFQQFLGHARGSLLEMETQLLIAVDLTYLSHEEFRQVEPRIAEVRRLLNGLLESLRVRGKAVGA